MSFYSPLFSPNYYYRPYISPIEKKYPWYKETIIIHAKINRIVSDSSVVLFLNGAQYDDFIRMTGAFTCIDAHRETHMFTFQPDDVVTIIKSNYTEVRAAWEEKRERYRQQLIKADKEREKKRAEEQSKQKEAEEAERMSHFWYRLFHRKKQRNDG